MIILAVPTFIALVFFKRAPYGRYAHEGKGYGFLMDGKTAWVLQECPCVLLAAVNLYFAREECLLSIPNAVLFALFSIHYIHRSVS